MRLRLLLGISVGWIPLAFMFDGVTVLLLPVRLTAAGSGASEIGLVSFLGLGTAVLIQPLAGHLSDRFRIRFDRRALMAGAAIPALVGLWLLVGPTGPAVAIVGYAMLQGSASAIQAAQQTFIPEHVGYGFRGRAAGIKAAFDVGGAFVAFLVLGGLLASGATTEAGVAISLLLVASLVIAARLVPPTDRGPGALARVGILTVPPRFARLIVARLLFLFGIYVVGRFMLLLVAERLAIDPARAADETGGLLALFTLVTALAAVPAGALADARGRTPLMVAGAGLAGIGILGLILPAGLLGVLAAGLLMSIGTAAFVTANWAAATDLAPAEGAGRLMGLANVGTGGAAACAGLLGPVVETAGFGPALALAGAVTLGTLLPLASLPWAARREEPA